MTLHRNGILERYGAATIIEENQRTMDNQDKQILRDLCEEYAIGFKTRERQARIGSPEADAVIALTNKMHSTGLLARYSTDELYEVMKELGYVHEPH